MFTLDAYEVLASSHARNIVKTIRDAHRLSDDKSVFVAACRNNDLWCDCHEGVQAHDRYLKSGKCELPTYVLDFYMLTTGLAMR